MTPQEYLDVDRWVLVDLGANPPAMVGVDNSNGGYPYRPQNARNVELWYTREAAEGYAEIIDNRWSSYGGPFKALRVIVDLAP